VLQLLVLRVVLRSPAAERGTIVRGVAAADTDQLVLGGIADFGIAGLGLRKEHRVVGVMPLCVCGVFGKCGRWKGQLERW
jgi:hypothetical protein